MTTDPLDGFLDLIETYTVGPCTMAVGLSRWQFPQPKNKKDRLVLRGHAVRLAVEIAARLGITLPNSLDTKFPVEVYEILMPLLWREREEHKKLIDADAEYAKHTGKAGAHRRVR